MPQVEISIGGRVFEVACQAGEEPYLRSAAQMLDAEAAALSAQIGRMPEARMLLMAGLMLADKTAGLEERLRESEARVAGLEREVHRLETAPREVLTETIERRIEVPVEVAPAAHVEWLQELAIQAEYLADRAEA